MDLQGPFDTFLVGGDTAEVSGMKFSNNGKLMLLSTTNGHVYVVDAYTGRKVCTWCLTDSCEHSWNARLFLILMNLDLLLCSYMDSLWSPTWMGGFWRLHSVQMHSLSLLVCFTAPIMAQNHYCQQEFQFLGVLYFFLFLYIRLFSRRYLLSLEGLGVLVWFFQLCDWKSSNMYFQ